MVESDAIRLVTPFEAVLTAVRECYSKYPWSVGLEDQDLGSLLFAMRLLPYRPALKDVSGAMEALLVERGIDTDEPTWDEIRDVFKLKMCVISGEAKVRVGGRDEMKKPKKILYWLHWALLGLVIAVSCVLYLLAIGFVASLVLPN